MGKVKNKEGSQTRFLEGEVRRLKKVIRGLESEIRSLKKYEHFWDVTQDEEYIADSEDTHPVVTKLEPCLECGKGFYQEFELVGRIFGTCNICEARKRLK